VRLLKIHRQPIIGFKTINQISTATGEVDPSRTPSAAKPFKRPTGSKANPIPAAMAQRNPDRQIAFKEEIEVLVVPMSSLPET